MLKPKKEKVAAIVGTTASGKTNVAVFLANLFKGEVVSADSRQVYRYMDIGSGKDLAEYVLLDKNGNQVQVPYHLIDVVSPNEEYDLAKWLSAAKAAVSDISSRSCLPIVAGGTGLYVQALLDGYILSEQGTNPALREELEKLDVFALRERLNRLDKDFVQSMNNSEKNNKRRLIRHIEILESPKSESTSRMAREQERPYDDLIIGLSWPREVLRKRIYDRIIKRLDKEGMLEEVETLHRDHGIPWQRLESFGLEYRFLARYLQKKISYDDMINELHVETCRFAKRQMTWLRRWEKMGTKINWINNQDEALALLQAFLSR